MIVIVDYGIGNLAAIKNMFKRIGVQSEISRDIKKIENASKIVLPGVGAFDSAMKKLNEGGFKPILDKKALEERVPVMGICLGMQLLMESSEEGGNKGLGWIKGKAKKFSFIDRSIKVPHMGWNKTKIKKHHKVVDGLEESKFYFVHSFHVEVEDGNDRLMETFYGIPFDSAVQKGNIFGFQFHPEKSHKYGMKLFNNFSKI